MSDVDPNDQLAPLPDIGVDWPDLNVPDEPVAADPANAVPPAPNVPQQRPNKNARKVSTGTGFLVGPSTAAVSISGSF